HVRKDKMSEQGYEQGESQGVQQRLWDGEIDATRNDAHDVPEGLTGVSEAPSGRSATIPDGAKRPQDHRKPAKRRITVKGMDLTVDVARVQDDYELMELMAEMEGSGDEENLPLVIKLVKSVLGDQYTTVKENCRAPEGHVSTKQMMEVIEQVFEEVGELGE